MVTYIRYEHLQHTLPGTTVLRIYKSTRNFGPHLGVFEICFTSGKYFSKTIYEKCGLNPS